MSGVLQKVDGTTYTKAALIAAATATATVTYYTLDQAVYRVDEYLSADGVDEKTLEWAAGTQVSTADLAAAYPTATFTSITPATGLAAGGTATVIKGTNLRGTSGVTFSGTAGTAFSVIDDETIHVTTPAKTAGAYNVVIAAPAGAVTAVNAYTYT